ncbi:MAG: glutamate--tRNA ligase, partial [Verrucomicrobiota bacterium]
DALETFDRDATDAFLHHLAEELDLGLGQLLPSVRLAVSGAAGGPDLFKILELLGRDEVKRRIEKTVETFKDHE